MSWHYFVCGCRKEEMVDNSVEDARAQIVARGWVAIDLKNADVFSCSPECWNSYHLHMFKRWHCSCEPQWHHVAHPVRGEIRLLDGFDHTEVCERRSIALLAERWDCPTCQRTDARAGATWGCPTCLTRMEYF